jgi:hypothetical protein
MFIGVYLIMTYDPQILFNDGFYPLIELNIPKGSLLKPEHPAALGCRTHALGRQFDILGGALAKRAPQFLTGAGWGSSPHMIYSGFDDDGKWFNVLEIGFGGIPARPFADGMDGHAMWPLFTTVPAEYMETYYPLRVEQYTSARTAASSTCPASATTSRSSPATSSTTRPGAVAAGATPTPVSRSVSRPTSSGAWSPWRRPATPTAW